MGHMTVRRIVRVLVSIAGVSLITYIGSELIPANETTIGFAYLLLVLVIASTWGFLEAGISSIVATLAFNFFFLPPVRTFTIADPQNWVALFTFLATALIASRLSAAAKRRAVEAVEHEQDVERLYALSRATLLIGAAEPFAKQLTQRLAEIFELSAAVLYDRRSDEMYRAGPSDFDGMEDQLRQAALQGTTFQDTGRSRIITAVRLGAEPIASLALQGKLMPDSVLQSIANLVAIGLERAKAQELFHQVETTRQTERLRTTLIDAMAHEFKTPLTSIKAATTSLLASPNQPESSRTELVKIADEEAERLKELIDDAVEMARLDAPEIDIQAERMDLSQVIRELVTSMRTAIDGRVVEVVGDPEAAPILADPRLVKLAIKQLMDNALKYSPPDSPLTLRVRNGEGSVRLEITDHGQGIPSQEQARIFQRFYRSPAVDKRIPGSGLGLSIAHRIAMAHRGDLTVTSQPGETTFRMTLPTNHTGEAK
jgi:two-component system, OmpR family, sensor histidine kinase KdpD